MLSTPSPISSHYRSQQTTHADGFGAAAWRSGSRYWYGLSNSSVLAPRAKWGESKAGGREGGESEAGEEVGGESETGEEAGEEEHPSSRTKIKTLLIHHHHHQNNNNNSKHNSATAAARPRPRMRDARGLRLHPQRTWLPRWLAPASATCQCSNTPASCCRA